MFSKLILCRVKNGFRIILIAVFTVFLSNIIDAAKVVVKQKTYVYSKPSTRSGRKVMVASQGSYFDVVGRSRTGVFLKVRKGRREGWILTKRTQKVRAVKDRTRRRDYQKEYDDHYYNEPKKKKSSYASYNPSGKKMEAEGILAFGDDVNIGFGGAFFYTLDMDFVPSSDRLDVGAELLYFPSGELEAGPFKVDFTAISFVAASRYYFPIAREFLVGPELGLMYLTASVDNASTTSDSETKFFIGGSAQYVLDDTWRIRGGLRVLLGGDVGGFMASGGAVYRF